jgi:hypothetical protein
LSSTFGASASAFHLVRRLSSHIQPGTSKVTRFSSVSAQNGVHVHCTDSSCMVTLLMTPACLGLACASAGLTGPARLDLLLPRCLDAPNPHPSFSRTHTSCHALIILARCRVPSCDEDRSLTARWTVIGLDRESGESPTSPSPRPACSLARSCVFAMLTSLSPAALHHPRSTHLPSLYVLRRVLRVQAGERVGGD